jgi:hypothetical protein
MRQRREIQAELERRLAHGEAALERLKGRVAETGHEASAEMRESAATVERALARGRTRLGEMAAATDEEFDEMWDSAKDAWHELANDAERGRDSLSQRVKGFVA